MATAILSGLHNVAANWDTGVVPVAPEVIVIPSGIVITQSGAWSIGDGLGITPAAVIDAGGELVLSGDTLTANGHVTLNGTLTHDFASTLLFAGGNWQITQGVAALWRTTAGPGLLPVITAAATYHWTWRAAANSQPVTVAINGLELRWCGAATIVGLELRGTNTDTLDFQFRNVLAADCGQLLFGQGSTHRASAICQIDGLVVVRTTTDASPTVGYMANFPAAWTADSRYMRNVYIAGAKPNGSPAQCRVARQNAATNPVFDWSFFLIDAEIDHLGRGNVLMSGSVIFDQYTGSRSEIYSGYQGVSWVIDGLVSATTRNNPHVVGSTFNSAAPGCVVTGVLADSTSPGGGNFLPHRNSVSLTNGLFRGINPFYSTAAEISGASTYAHCTHITTAVDNQPSMLQETNAALAAYQVSGLSNIRVDTGATPNVSFAAIQPSIPGAVDQYYDLDFNNHYMPNEAQPFNPYPTVVITGVAWGDARLGGSDLFVDPQFVDGTRGLREYDTLMGGAGTFINLFREAFKASGWDVNGNAATLTPGYAMADAKAWVEAGYVPQNPALQGAAHDGGDIGAFAVVPLVDLTAPVITLLGDAVVTLLRGETYVDAGATAVDDTDGDLTAAIVTVNAVDTSVVGVYAITYNAVDAAGNPATQVTRTVNISTTSSYKPQTSFTGGING